MRPHEPSKNIAQWGTFGVDAKDAGNGERDFLFALPMTPSAKLKSQSLSNPVERAWVRGRGNITQSLSFRRGVISHMMRSNQLRAGENN